jgi:hypothetical protein
MKMETMNKGDMVAFVDMMTTKGWINGNTGGGYKAALSKILGDVPGEEDVRKIDVKTQVLRYNNLNPGDLSPASLKQYEKRVAQCIQHFINWKTDPTAFKPPQRVLSNGNGDKPDKPKATAKAAKPALKAAAPTPAATTDAPREHELPKPAVGTSTGQNLVLPYPLRPGYLAQIIVPLDMTKDEAARLCAFISTLAAV